MDKVKKAVHYWCEDTLSRRCTGKGVNVAVLDTGLAPHPDFRGRIMAFKDCVNKNAGLYDDSGHGTHVAGILAGDGKLSKGILAGMAPGAKLIIIKVLDRRGEGSIEQIYEGIQWLKKNWKQYGIRVVNISVGAKSGIDARKEECLIEVVEQLWDMGLSVIVSAGNYGPGEGTVAIPGTSRKVLTVGALNRNGSELNCSGQGPTGGCVVKPDIVAPGHNIISCGNVSVGNRRLYTVKSGTSMATPVVSGAIALLLDKYPDMSNVEMKLWMRACCDSGIQHTAYSGWGKLNVEKMMRYQ